MIKTERLLAIPMDGTVAENIKDELKRIVPYIMEIYGTKEMGQIVPPAYRPTYERR
ncbi:hypothetical protein [Paenibacillus thermotolerans]|uniref:hypothetical protein n=1 Tax=Paenibacillus thermotolerans TaxID=3027807 RepID=UPI002367F5E8|nr:MULTISPECIES: hypothetical protein [unclassified Paenibacillus]